MCLQSYLLVQLPTKIASGVPTCKTSTSKLRATQQLHQGRHLEQLEGCLKKEKEIIFVYADVFLSMMFACTRNNLPSAKWDAISEGDP